MPKRKIITIDDSSSIRHVIKSYLEAEGYEVHEAKDGVEGLETVKKNNFDLLLIDVNMPRMDGITLVREIRKLAQYKTIPIIILTTESQEAKKLEGMKAGATGWIVKPFEPNVFLKVLDRLVKK